MSIFVLTKVCTNVERYLLTFQVQKRQALIPFPRTGKRATIPTTPHVIHKYGKMDEDEVPDYVLGLNFRQIGILCRLQNAITIAIYYSSFS